GQLGVVLSEGQVGLLLHYAELLLDYNQRVNLTGAKDLAELEVRHLLDSITVAPHLPDAPASVIDVGSGGGLPGLPLAIVRPELSFTLLDSVGKKTTFLEQTVATLGLANVAVINTRAELAAQTWDYRQRFTIALSRAVAELPLLIELTVPFLKLLGRAILMKKGDIAAEVTRSRRSLRAMGGDIVEIAASPLPELLPEHQLVIVEKTRPTNSQYPRRPGIPERRPLG
ncbi:MAG TPA: 16S rRNA (guanine(527)-N(7))-methyltransferase RsmG, partial [Chloroflexota bacterium]|nr:16S rRNA (guanine(527)-N(7))-methyltransferase RsmG [Chloroflexota bacterium]